MFPIMNASVYGMMATVATVDRAHGCHAPPAWRVSHATSAKAADVKIAAGGKQILPESYNAAHCLCTTSDGKVAGSSEGIAKADMQSELPRALSALACDAIKIYEYTCQEAGAKETQNFRVGDSGHVR
jgi:phosphotransferase system HPr-like phosphotransfer protein